MINRVHGHTPDMRALALPAGPSGFAKLLALMFRIANLTYAGPAFPMEAAHFA
jgi:hypothetical protein